MYVCARVCACIDTMMCVSVIVCVCVCECIRTMYIPAPGPSWSSHDEVIFHQHCSMSDAYLHKCNVAYSCSITLQPGVSMSLLEREAWSCRVESMPPPLSWSDLR